MGEKRDSAQGLLLWHLGVIYKQAGGTLSPGQKDEIEAIVSLIIDAAKEEIMEKIQPQFEALNQRLDEMNAALENVYFRTDK